MNLSSRQAPPTMSMRRAPAPDGALLSPSWSSSFSSKYGIHQMLESPMPSPALPSIVPRHGKKPKPNYFRKLSRWLLSALRWICGLVVVGWLLRRKYGSAILPLTADDASLGQRYHLVGEDLSSQDPTPVLIANPKGKSKYSISLPQQLDFPLKPSEYRNICSASKDISYRLRHQNSRSEYSHSKASNGHYHVDPNFMDVHEAETQGLFPIRDSDQLPGGEDMEGGGMRKYEQICEKTLTYVLETTDAGIGKTLLGLWLSYGLAKEENRAFFIDDSNWSYGKYGDLFQSPSAPSCLPAPPHHRLPCPRQARHLVVSASTSQWAFGETSQELFQHSGRTISDPLKRTFTLLRTGYEALFHLPAPDASYVTSRLAELDNLRSKGSRVVGLHVRRGDRHPWEFQYKDSYIPLEAYVDAANAFIARDFHPDATNSSLNSQSDKSTDELESQILLASDDPDIYAAQEMKHTHRAQSHISLANKAALDAASPTTAPRHSDSEVIFNKFVEGNVGWEGGFFPSVFWGLGNAAAGSLAARGLRAEREDPPPSDLSLSLRQLVARAYLLDLRILGASDAVVCGVSSVGCRLLAVMLGWEKGILEGRWKNIDGTFGWRALEEETSHYL